MTTKYKLYVGREVSDPDYPDPLCELVLDGELPRVGDRFLGTYDFSQLDLPTKNAIPDSTFYIVRDVTHTLTLSSDDTSGIIKELPEVYIEREKP